jgi:hypothetical protein
MAATPKKAVSKAPPVTSTFKNDKQWIKQQINQLVKLAGSKGVNGTAKEKKIWSQIDNLRTTLGTLKDSNRRSLVRGDGKMTYPGGKSTRVVKGVMLNDNGARAALNTGGKGAAMPGNPTPKTPTGKEPWAVRKSGGAAGDWVTTKSGQAALDKAGVKQDYRGSYKNDPRVNKPAQNRGAR